MAKIEQNFKGLVVIVTGGSSGFGAEIVKSYSSEGASVVFSGRNTENLEMVKQQCLKDGADPKTISWTAGDISEEATRQGIVDCAILNYGRIDILVNNAGIVYASNFDKTQFSDFDKVLDVNLAAVFKLTCLCIPHIKKTKGNIVNISSIAGTMPYSFISPYCISKAALEMLTKCAAAELGPFGVRVNAIAPGAFPTTNIARYTKTDPCSVEKIDANISEINRQIPMRRSGVLKEIADAVLFITSGKATYISGAILPVDGALKCAHV